MLKYKVFAFANFLVHVMFPFYVPIKFLCGSNKGTVLN